MRTVLTFWGNILLLNNEFTYISKEYLQDEDLVTELKRTRTCSPDENKWEEFWTENKNCVLSFTAN